MYRLNHYARRFPLATVLFLTLAQHATAQSNTKDWSGPYFGAFLGGAIGSSISSTEPTDEGGDAPFTDNTGGENYSTNPSFMGGLTLGYNYMLDQVPVILGFEGEYGYLSLQGSANDHNDIGSDVTGNYSTNIGGGYGYSVFGGRLGYAIGSAMLFAKAGGAITNVTSSYSFRNLSEDISSPNHSTQNNKLGFAVGGGLEFFLPYEILDNVSLKLEYLYLGINQSQTLSETVKYYDSGTEFAEANYTSTTHITGVHTGKLGLNYHF